MYGLIHCQIQDHFGLVVVRALSVPFIVAKCDVEAFCGIALSVSESGSLYN
jgi:hypothetical protein